MNLFSELVSKFDKANAEMQALIHDAPRIAGVVGVKVIKENFALQKFDSGNGGEPWGQRKPATDRAYDRRWGVKGTVYKSSNPILVQTGNLRDSITFEADGSNVRIGTDISYAKAHNEGENNEPKRKFLDYSPKLETEFKNELDRKTTQIMNKI